MQALEEARAIILELEPMSRPMSARWVCGSLTRDRAHLDTAIFAYEKAFS